MPIYNESYKITVKPRRCFSVSDLELIAGSDLAVQMMRNCLRVIPKLSFNSSVTKSFRPTVHPEELVRLSKFIINWIESHTDGIYFVKFDEKQNEHLEIGFENAEHMVHFKLSFEGLDSSELY